MNTFKNTVKMAVILACVKGIEHFLRQPSKGSYRVRSITRKRDPFEKLMPCEPEEQTYLFYEPISREFIRRTFKEVIEAEYHLNRNFVLRGYTDVDELHDFLGMNRLPFEKGKELGWSMYMGEAYYGYDWIDFYHKEMKGADGRQYFIIETPFPPTKDFMGVDED